MDEAKAVPAAALTEREIEQGRQIFETAYVLGLIWCDKHGKEYLRDIVGYDR
ncbi:hypothetical protein [Hyphomicrobium sp.]|jgi:hypothetical protein|uniref:hypothetical protein n=1 Tax=Hyphomicrobium sp. TaxID=82 RepID=UPI0035656124